MAGNAKHKRRVKLRRAAKELKRIEERREATRRLGRSIDRFGTIMDSPIAGFALASMALRRIEARRRMSEDEYLDLAAECISGGRD